MKTTNFFKKTAAALILAVISFAGCDSVPENTMTMTTAIKGEVDILLAGTGEAVIDWGDGSAPDTVTLSAVDEYLTDSNLYIHSFPDTTSRTIVIEGQNITHLHCGGLQLTALDVSKNTALTQLGCHQNKLTALDVTKNTALTRLWCFYNRLTAEGLNALFNTLPGNAGNKRIYIVNNPGADDCDRNIATAKGWTVETGME